MPANVRLWRQQLFPGEYCEKLIPLCRQGFGASFLALNAMIGSGIFALPGKVAVNAGLLSPWLFIVVGALFITVVLTFAELSSYYDRTGGPVLYATDAFGPLAGFSTGWAFYLSRMTAFAANANVMAIYLASLHDVFAGDTAKVVIITVATVGMTWANILGVRDGVRTKISRVIHQSSIFRVLTGSRLIRFIN